MAEGLTVEDCVETIAQTLPICSVRGVAYSTFTIMHLVNNQEMELIQYDNPLVILLRDGKNYDYPKSELTICGKKIYKSTVKLEEGDIFIAMSDGCPHAGIGIAYNFGWKREDIIQFMETMSVAGYAAKSLSTILIDEVNRLYDGKPGDDATACVVKIRKRVPMNMLFGPPSNRDDCNRMMALFFSKEGREAYRLRRNHLFHCGEISGEARKSQPEFCAERHSAYSRDRRCGLGDRGRHHSKQSGGICPRCDRRKPAL